MKIRIQLLFSAAAALLFVLLSWVATEIASEQVADSCRWLLFPGFMADVWVSGNVHSGLGGVSGIVVETLGATIFWTLPLWLLVELFSLSFRKKKDL